jgi:outer membrane cobalamin receptor
VSADGAIGRWSYGASLAYVGAHLDIEDSFPFGVEQLHAYWLAGARIAYQLTRKVQLFVRGSNLLNAHYEDSAGYHTEGRGLFAGIRLEGG